MGVRYFVAVFAVEVGCQGGKAANRVRGASYRETRQARQGESRRGEMRCMKRVAAKRGVGRWCGWRWGI